MYMHNWYKFCTLNACDLHTGTSFRYRMHTYALINKPDSIACNGLLLA